MKIFIDSSIISSFLKEELSKDEINSLETILLSFKANQIEVITLDSTKEKINKIPELFKNPNITFIKLLKEIPSIEEIGYCNDDCHDGLSFESGFDPLYQKLINLVDNLEARQLFQGIKSEANFFVTKSPMILNKKDEIKKCRISVLSSVEMAGIIVGAGV
jgi:hypothetical protein